MNLFPPRSPAPPLSDGEVEALLRGGSATGQAALPGAATLVEALRGLSASPPPARGALAGLLRDGFDPDAVAPAAIVPPVGGSRPRRRALLHVAGLTVTAKVLLGAGVAVAGVAAAGGGLLGPAAADRVADLVQLVRPDRQSPGTGDTGGGPAATPSPDPQDEQLPVTTRPAIPSPAPAAPQPGQAATDEAPAPRPAPVPDGQDEQDEADQGEPEDGRRTSAPRPSPARTREAREQDGQESAPPEDEPSGQGSAPPEDEPSGQGSAPPEDEGAGPADGAGSDTSAADADPDLLSTDAA